jgi:ABC-type multidrug transport system fused ATPase/permease subunit
MEASLLPWWRQRVAYVPQETVLFPGSVRENLAWSARGEIDDDAIWSALRRAAADFAVDLPDGLDTMLGDRGVRLSGGERQRMAIARALLRDPALLVLDEATSALDDETEAEVLATLRNLVPAVTVLVVAHRRSTLEAADQVIRVEDGSVAD